jgi:hypothetical protein
MNSLMAEAMNQIMEQGYNAFIAGGGRPQMTNDAVMKVARGVWAGKARWRTAWWTWAG